MIENVNPLVSELLERKVVEINDKDYANPTFRNEFKSALKSVLGSLDSVEYIKGFDSASSTSRRFVILHHSEAV